MSNHGRFVSFSNRHPDAYRVLLAASDNNVGNAAALYAELTKDGDESGLLDALAQGRAEGVRRERERCEDILALGVVAGVHPTLMIHAVESGVDPLTARDLFSVRGRTGRALSSTSTFASLMVNVPQRASGA